MDDPQGPLHPGKAKPNAPAGADTEPTSFERMAHDHSAAMLTVGVDSGRIIEANPAAGAFYGRTAEELRGLPLRDLVEAPTPDEAEASGISVQTHRVAQGRTRRVLVASGPGPTGSVETSRLWIILDIEELDIALKHRQSELLNAMLDASGDSTMCLDEDMRVVYVNQRLADISGTPRDHWIGKTHRELGYPDDLVQFWEGHNRKVFDTAEVVTYEFEIENSGQRQWYETTISPLIAPDGHVGFVIATSRDITARKATEESLRTSQDLLERAQRIAHVGTWRLTSATNAVTWSAELSRMVGLDPALPAPDLQDQERLFTPESWASLNLAITEAEQDGTPYELELQMVRPDGSTGWMLARGEAVRASDQTIIGVQGVALDITERKSTMERLQAMATHDILTGLPNRAGLIAEITRGLSADRRSGRATAVLMLDLDGFKDVNDVFGHSTGDDLLVSIAARLRGSVRGSDLVARLGGDEFVVVMRHLNEPTDALNAADRLVKTFHKPFSLHAGEVFVTASIGVAIANPTDDADALVGNADTAMYAAKEAGRDRVSVFDEGQRAAVSARLALDNELRQAAAKGDFMLWYQPELDLRTGEIVSVEALLRWRDAQGRTRDAHEFIKALESTGLILDVGAWALREACRQGAKWTDLRPDRPVSMRVNLGVKQATNPSLLACVDDALQASGLDPSLLCIEVDDATLSAQPTAVRANLRGLHDRGIGLLLDDFGTGFLSLADLQQYPIDILKIDVGQVLSPHDDEQEHDHRFVIGIITLAGIFGIGVTAQRVEREVQAKHLVELGCHRASGWLYYPAMPAERVTPLLRGPHALG